MTQGQPLNPQHPGQHAIPYEVIQRAVVDPQFRAQLLDAEHSADFNDSQNLGISDAGLEFLAGLDAGEVQKLLDGFEEGLFM